MPCKGCDPIAKRKFPKTPTKCRAKDAIQTAKPAQRTAARDASVTQPLNAHVNAERMDAAKRNKLPVRE
uniref:Uncharacterized protein n=1 Tax=Lutzomyia longipalpis TaxID=7200 RepID=A0A1B0CW81_LUTLO